MNNNYAVITGASRGLGKSFALQLAKKGKNLILISLEGENLPTFANELSVKYNIKSLFFETDLTILNSVMEIAGKINHNYNIDMLINNAGTGGSKKFEDASAEYLYNILQLNITATIMLTRLLLPNLKNRKRSFILNVSSLAAFSPIGYKTVYPASKAFIHSFSRGLYQELKDTGVFVSVINPGAMKTNADVTKRIEHQGFRGKLSLLDPEKVAERALRKLEKRDTVIMMNHFSWLMLKLTPIWIRLPLLTNAVKRELSVKV
jgi:hypothetical protein